MTITLYDIASKRTGKTWSPNPWKVRYVLSYKGLPYTTRYLEYPDLEPELKKVGIPPNGKNPDGSPLYTSPSITDDDGTGAAVADSYKIAEYLDKHYPATPKVFPPGTEALQAAFYDQFNQLVSPIWPVLFPQGPTLLNPRSAEYFTKKWGAYFKKRLDQVDSVEDVRAEALGKIKAVLDTLDGWRSKSGGTFFMGETITFADIVVASFLQSVKVMCGEDCEEWQQIKVWDNGKWVEFLGHLEPYASDEN